MRICLIVCFLLAACSQEKEKSLKGDEVTVIRRYYPNGQLKLEVPVDHNRKNGLAKSFYEDGTLRQTIEYMNGYKHGTAHTYYPNGELYMVSRYMYNTLHGIRERYHPDGQLMSEAPFVEGNPAVGLKEYLLDGKPRKYYPIIHVEERLRKDVLELVIRLSDDTRRVEFFLGQLNPDGFIEKEYAKPIKTSDGVARLKVNLTDAGNFQETVYIVAEATTRQGNAYILSHEYALTALIRGL